MATAATKLMTAAEFEALDIDVPVELVRGEVVATQWNGMQHGEVCSNLLFSLEFWVQQESSDYLVVSAAGILTEHDPDTVRGPDVYLLRRDQLPAGEVIPGFLKTPPELCVEVVSPNDIWKDVIAKVDEYLQAGVLEVWVIEPDERQIYAYRPDGPPRTCSEGSTLASSAINGLSLAITDVFRDVPANS